MQVSELSSEPISALLAKWQAGDEEAFRALVPRLYKELRRLARYHLQRNGRTTRCRPPHWCTRLICAWPDRDRDISRTALISWPFHHN
jgi:hypothetical protein